MPLDYSVTEIAWIAFSIFLLSMSKGGFPAGAIALPLLILVWPDRVAAARDAVSFMLPLLCCMDILAFLVYRRHVRWEMIWPLLPGTFAGVLLGSLFFVSEDSALISVSDKALKVCIGLLGVAFTVYHLAKKRILSHLESEREPGFPLKSAFGLGAGITSTLAHAAGPVMQMYFLPRKLAKMNFVATTVAFFLILNAVKMIPFAVLGRIKQGNLMLGAYILPVIPLGVGTGYILVRLIKQKYYTVFIYVVLYVTSIVLIARSML